MLDREPAPGSPGPVRAIGSGALPVGLEAATALLLGRVRRWNGLANPARSIRLRDVDRDLVA
jgi:hypothetical protein